MAQEHWYYSEKGRREGPVLESWLLGMFEAGYLGPETLVWSESMEDWTRASEVEAFKSRVTPSQLSKSDKPLPVSDPKITSGQGKSTVIPHGIKKWSWGAFALTWIWGLANKTYITLIILIPGVSFATLFVLAIMGISSPFRGYAFFPLFLAIVVMAFIIGIKGSKWAWQSKRWDSINHFEAVQKKWSKIGNLIFVFEIIGILVSLQLPCTLAYRKKALTTEAKQGLGHIRTLEMTYDAKYNEYGSLAEISWLAPTGKRRYTYSLSYSSDTFLARAAGNLDRDDTIDTWTINQNNTLAHLVDDLKH